MKTSIALILVLAPVFILALLHSSGALAASDGPDVSDGGAARKESQIIAPNDFNPELNYSYENIDNHAINVSASEEINIESLASNLSAPARNEREKARSIFRWITENIDYDDTGYFRGSSAGTSSKDVLNSRRSICNGYSDLFSSLASSAGLEVVRISGHGKGYGYLTGESLPVPPNHAWNAVKINGSWYLIDCTWGAGYMDANKEFVRRFDDHYFMTPPSEFIHDHFPEDSAWQLLEHPLSKSEFEKLVFVKPEFFKYGIRLGDEREGTIRAVKRINISVFAPNNVLLIADLRYLDGELISEMIGNYALCERDGDRYDIFVQFPKPGKYILKAYAKHKDEPGEYHGVIEYAVDAVEGDIGSPGFPMTYGSFTEGGAYLLTPMEGALQSGTTYRFRISVPEAENVTVICGDEWSYLGAEGDMFEGNITVTKGNVLVAAKFQKAIYDVLLKYAVY